METERLYYLDAYEAEFDAEVVSCIYRDGIWLVELTRTCFYPEGGGQPGDTGVLIVAGHEPVAVRDTHEKDGKILHYLNHEIPVGTFVHGMIDFERRFDHMQQHSGEHIASGLICRAFDTDNVGFHMGKDTVTIDYDAEISMEDLKDIEEKANRYVWEDHAVSTLVTEGEELKSIDYRSKKEISGAVRIVTFPGADCCACCGTHVRRSSEAGPIKFISAHRFKRGTRIELVCGQRAYRYLCANWEQNMLLSRAMAAHFDETWRIYQKQMNEVSELKARLALLESRYFETLADRYRGAGDVLIFEPDLSPDSLRRLAVTIAACCGGRCAVFSAASPKDADSLIDIGIEPAVKSQSEYKYAIMHEGADLGAFVQSLNEALKGHGGGRGGFAQGSCHASREEIERFFDTGTVYS